ncbi:helix-turn-helix transcriptional regulator [Thiomonas intermedia]|uniref:helix-turn-helix transcriptional regulator n=1 Tax=Thiomonas intermedia TaxID=926 RepID=UPI0009A52C86|nr:helix-turn-helix domain-containing protein [Thiomonas intermedia]
MPDHLNGGTPHSPANWAQLLSRRFVPGHIRLSSHGPGGHIEQEVRAGAMLMTPLVVQPQIITHTAQHLSDLTAEARDSVLSHIVIEGDGVIEQEGTALRFRGGDLSFRNLQQPSRIVFETPARLIAVKIPRSTLLWHQARREDRQHLRPGIVASSHLHGLLPTNDMGSVSGLYAGFALPWLIAAAYHSIGQDAEPAYPPNATRWQQVLSYVEAHLFDASALSPSRCARAVGISERYLHRLASLRGITFSRLVKHRRLEAARVLLEHPASRHMSVASVAYQCGFTDPAHFSRAYRQCFGHPPRQSRKSTTATR